MSASRNAALVLLAGASMLGCYGASPLHPCGGVSCSGHGECVAADGVAACWCDPGYYAEGLACLETEGTPCEGVECSSHGTCTVVDGAAQCACEPGYQASGTECLCVPDCGERECGADPHCGEPCGECGAGDTCDGAGSCRPGAWVLVHAGTYMAGVPLDEVGRYPFGDDEPHEVTVERDFLVLSTEVTQADFEAVMGYNPTLQEHGECADCPADGVNWWEAAAYCNALSASEGLAPCYECAGEGQAVECEADPGYAEIAECEGYRLPTQWEWEYAARSGTTTATYAGELEPSAMGTECAESEVLNRIAWYCWNAGRDLGTQPVGLLEPTPWGLYDVLGNVREWCHDDGIPGFKLLRGRDCGTVPQLLRVGVRDTYNDYLRGGGTGFRPVRSVF